MVIEKNDDKLPLIIGLTNSTGVCKSEVLNIFSDIYKVPVFDGDLCFRFVIHYNDEISIKIRKEFGGLSYIGNFLNAPFFDNDDKMRRLFYISEDEVFNLFNRWLYKQKSDYVIFSLSALFELEFGDKFDAVINVFAPKSIREESSESMNEYNESIINREFSSIVKNTMSDYVVHNYNNMSLNRQINNINSKISNSILEW